jgi:ATP-dependent DNA helicase RecG
MNLPQVKKILSGIEWTDVEFKAAVSDVPKSAFETVSAFANTHGGWLIFGITQNIERYEIAGVTKPDKIQNDFLSVLHADQKINHDVTVTGKKFRIDGKTILAFHIAENIRTRKPVYLDGDIRRTFVRRGGGDYRAKLPDIERMLRDATEDRWDSQIFERVALKEAFNESSLAWYRSRFHQHNSGFDPKQPDFEFLHQWGYLIKDGRKVRPTKAAVMLFGSPLAIHQLIPRPTLDVQFLPYGSNDDLPETRWIDRFVCEENIIQSWLQLLTKYMFFMPKPFKDIDPVTLERRDSPPGFRVFREAAINLLIHQDYADHSRKAVIKFFKDGIQLWNPGDVFGDDRNLLKPGEKEVRNPGIAAAMRRIIMCEQAGTGLRMMREQWKKLGHPEPKIKNDRGWKAFEFFLPGLDAEADLSSDLMKAMFPEKKSQQATNTVGSQSRARVEPESTARVEPESETLAISDKIIKILQFSHYAKAEISNQLGQKKISGPLNAIIRRLLDEGYIERTIPDKPNSRLQKYRLTEKGRMLLKETADVQ